MLKFVIKGTENFGKTAVRIREVKSLIPDELKKICDTFGNKVVRLAKEKYILNRGKGAPVDPLRISSRTGNLRRNVVFETKVEGFNAFVNVGVRRNVPYARIHEFGGTQTSSRGKSYYIKARPYLTPSIEEALPELKANLTVILERIRKTK